MADPLAPPSAKELNEAMGMTDAIPLAKEREQMAIDAAQAVFKAARNLLTVGSIQAVGYRVLIKPIEGVLGLEAAEAAKSPTLAAADFQVKSDRELEKEDRGTDEGVVIHLGPRAFDRMGGREMWCDEGDVVVFNKYTGVRKEHPKGSGVFYQLMNDEDIFGRIR